MYRSTQIIFIFLFLSSPVISAQLIGAEYSIKSVSANTKYSDYGATFFGPNRVVFASNAKESKMLKGRMKKNKSPDELPKFDLYTGYLSNNGEIQYVTPVFSQTSNKYNESNVAFTPDLKYVYFTQNNIKGKKYVADKNNWINLKIYRAEIKQGNQWVNVEELPFNSDDYSCAHPSLSEDGRILFFTSDMPGTYGQSDIYWITVNDDGTFGTPHNLGSTINSRYKENFPYIDGNILYFSSDRPGGKGGLDIYMVSLDETIGSPACLNPPVNSPYDDFCFVIDRKHKRGFFSSNRPNGKGQDDIYFFKQETKILECKYLVSGEVTDVNTGKPVPGATVMLLNKKGYPVSQIKTGKDGTYRIQTGCNTVFSVATKKQGYFTVKKKLDGKKRNNTELTVDFELSGKGKKSNQPEIHDELARKDDNPIEQNKKDIPEETQHNTEEQENNKEDFITTNNEGKEILNVPLIYFNLNQYTLTKEARNILDKVAILLKEHPDIRVQFEAHTDCRASKAYNLHLSQMRAESVVKYLLSSGISPDRISGKGYGESRPVNHCVDGVKCTEREHLQNRRTEFVILQ